MALHRLGSLLLLAASVSPTTVPAQPKTRVGEIEASRRAKRAELWPELQSPLVDPFNAIVERGLYEGVRTGQGTNGWQLVLGGMRSGQGASAGVGYRRADLFRERLDLRATARSTPEAAYLLDTYLELQGLHDERFFADLYTKLEDSPQMDYYGPGPDSIEENRTSYAYETFSVDLRAGLELTDWLRLGGTLGGLDASLGSGKRSGVPSTEIVFDPSTTPGLGEGASFGRYGAFVEVDYRDLPTGPRSGGYYAVIGREHDDVGQDRFGFTQVLVEAQQYVPYFNETRVIALRAAASFAFERDGQRVPFYLQPSLGGNDELRGFGRYRFHDDHALMLNLEHRWYGSELLDVALFADAGKVAPRLADIDPSGLEWSGGIGFRFKFQGAYVMRLDFARSREGFRFTWTFSDVFETRFGSYD